MSNGGRIILRLALGLSLASCSGHEFSSPGGSDRDHKEGAQNPYGSGYQDPNLANANGNSINGGSVGGVGGALCTQGGSINVVIIFDRSGSQTRSDMASMRSGALNFINGFSGVGGTNTAVQKRVVAAAFSDGIHPGMSGWQDITNGNVGAIVNDINQVTSDKGGDTHYVAALQYAQSMFQQVGANVSQKNQRNFLIFFSDGDPDDEGSGIDMAVTSLVQSAGVALFTVATGASGDHVQYLQKMAQPTGGVVAPDHVGVFYQASNQSMINNAFAGVLDRLRTLCP